MKSCVKPRPCWAVRCRRLDRSPFPCGPPPPRSTEVSRSTAVILTSRLPWPLDDGGRVAAWQNVRAASRVHDTTLISLVPPGEDRTPLPRVFEDHGIRVLRVAHRPPAGPGLLWRGLFGPLPYTLDRYR